MPVADVLAKVAQGLAGVGNNPQASQEITQWQDNRAAQRNAPAQMSLQARSLAVKGLQQKLATLTPDTPEYHDTLDQIQENIHGMREIVAPDQKLGAGDWLKTHLTDRMHITSHAGRLADLQRQQQAGAAQDQQTTRALGQGVVPTPNMFLDKYNQAMKVPGTTADEALRAAGLTSKGNFRNIAGPNGEKATIDLNTQEIPPGWTLAGVTSTTAAGLKPIASGGVTIGVTANGKPYFAKDVNNPDTPEEVKSFFASLDEGQKSKIAQKEKDRQEQYAEMEKRQRISLSAAMQRTIAQFQNALATKQAGIADSVVGKQQQQVATDMSLENRMQALMPEALAGNQQAMVGIVANHIAMTTHQPGAAMRPTKALFDEAANSQPWLQSVTKKFDSDGVLVGIVLSPEQIQNMVQLAPMLTAADQSALEQMQSQLGSTMNPTPVQLQPKGKPGAPKKPTPAGGFDWNSAPPVK